MSHIIKIGNEVRCVITGVVGLAVSKVECLNGNIRFAVQPKSQDNLAMPDAWHIDQQSLEFVNEGIVDRAIEPSDSYEVFDLGARVRDKASGFEGTAVSRITYLNGCVSYGVVPKVNPKSLINEAPPETYLMVERLELVGQGIAKEVESTKPQEPTGGPSLRQKANRAPRF